MAKKLEQYRNSLSASKIAEGMNAAIQNAQRLLSDAILMLDNGHYPTAASLAVLSIEESGKVSILRGLSVARNENEIVECWREYRSHTKKNAIWLMPQLLAQGARKLDDFARLFDADSDHPYILDQIKQIGFYTDCLGAAHWLIPSEGIDEDLAKMVVQIAKIFAGNGEVTPKEVELWIKHIGPVWKKSNELMKSALVAWYAEMQENGLATGQTNRMEKFIQGVQAQDNTDKTIA